MLNIDTLSKNKYIFNPDMNMADDGLGIWDLTKSSVTYKEVSPRIESIFFASENEEMRPDLIASRIFGTTNYVGSILKTNMVSNPFSIESGDQIVVFKSSTMDSMIENKKTEDSNSKESANFSQTESLRKVQDNKKFQVSNSRSEYLNRIAKVPAQPLPPNVMQEGDSQTLRTDDLIIFGPSVSSNGPSITQ
jgi:hypothetical protein